MTYATKPSSDALPLEAGFSRCTYATSDRVLTGNGWALGSIDSVWVLSPDGTVLGAARMGDIRKDVTDKYPQYGNDAPGWSFSVPYDIDTYGAEGVTVLVEGASGTKSMRRTAEILPSRVAAHFQKKPLPKNDFAPFVGKHRGQRAFIVGNGPSLNQIDMGLLKDELTFGSNRVYLGFEKWGYHFSYWACQDELQIKQGTEYYNRDLPPDMIKFVPQDSRHLFTTANTHAVNLLWRTDEFPKFTTSPNVFFEGWTVTYLLLQIAFLMGCDPIYLVGVDYSYKIGDSEKRGLKWADDQSSSHFISDYMAADAGVVWNVPQFEKTDLAFACAAGTLRAQGVSVYNATPGSKLGVFQKVDYASLFGDTPRFLNSFGAGQGWLHVVALSDNPTDVMRAQNASAPDQERIVWVPKGSAPPVDASYHWFDADDAALATRVTEALTPDDRVLLSVSYRIVNDAEYRSRIDALLNRLPPGRCQIAIGDKRPAPTVDEAIAIKNVEWVS